MMTPHRAARPIALGLALLATRAEAADSPRNPAPTAIGSPATVEIWPKDSALIGRRATRQLILTAVDPDGSVRDLTRAVDWMSLDPTIATVSAKGQVIPKGNGTATIVGRKGSVEAKTTVVVSKTEAPAPVSFRLDVVPAFSQANCNMGACHGTPTGKGGFKLSLRGYLPDQDFVTLSRDSGSRRINPIAAESSMVLLKPLGEIAHEGGLRLTRSSKSYEFIRDWIAEGAHERRQTGHRDQARNLPRLARPEQPGEDPADVRDRPLFRRHEPRRHTRSVITTPRTPRSPTSTPMVTSRSSRGARSR